MATQPTPTSPWMTNEELRRADRAANLPYHLAYATLIVAVLAFSFYLSVIRAQITAHPEPPLTIHAAIEQ